MRISCPSCQSSYKIADEKVQGRTVKVRCRKCGMTIHVNEQGVMNDAAAGAAAPEPAAGGADPGGAPQFSVLVAEGDQRDMGLQDIVAAYNSGVVTADTFVWGEGLPDWMALGEVPSIVEALNAASEAVDKVATTGENPAQPQAAAPPVQEPASDPMAGMPAEAPAQAPMADAAAPEPSAAPVPEPAPAPEPSAHEPAPAPAALFGAEPAPAAPAAAPAADAGGSPLFGGSSTAAVQASYDNKADLFSAQAIAGSEEDVATSAPQMSPAVNKPTAARDESSVLFSLSALTSSAASTSSGGGNGSAAGDDSGLIDLRALADKDADKVADAAPAAPAIGGGILDSAPLLGSPVDPSLHQLKASEPPPAKKNMGLLIGIAIGAVGILSAVVTVVVVLTREPPPPPPAPTVAMPEPTEIAPSVAATPAPTGTDSSAAAAPATGAPSATAAPTTAKPSSGGRYTGGKSAGTKSTPKSTSGTKATAAPTKKAPPKNKCNCPPGDLACNMACAVK